MNMKRLIYTTFLASGLLLAASVQAAAEAELDLDAPSNKVSYAIGLNIGMNLKAQGFEVDPNVIAKGVKDAFGGRPELSQEEARTAIVEYQQNIQAKMQAKLQAESKANREAGAAFLAENAKKEGVKTTASGLQYKVLFEGRGEVPKADHTVTVNYRGTLIDGTEFDSSYSRNQPATFGVRGVIPGWTEALLMMRVGARWQLFIPADLAYGDQQRGEFIKPGSTLIFEIELLSSKGPEPIVSDIIKVPSAEEMKKGAKIETLKPEDVERLKAEQNKK
jgi:FKBP-type peptidyl-prolyl cis-trans isomerase FklB